MKKRLSAWIILGIITIVAGFSLAVTNEVTKKPILDQGVLSQTQAKLKVMPGAERFEEITLEDGQVLYIAKAGDTTLGYVGKTERKGYGGLVEIIAGVTDEGTITGINVGGTSFSETPGLGARSKDAAFTDQFAGKKAPVKLGKDQSDSVVDAITAATITSSAVVAGVNQIAKQVDQYLNPVTKPEIPVQAEGTSYGASSKGFAGQVAVVVTVKDDGTITALTIGDDQFSETEGFGAAALEPSFAAQFIGKSVPLALTDIEAISGATYTSEAVVSAINKAYEEKLVIETPSISSAGSTYTASAEGFGGPVAVEVTIKEDNTISALKIGDDQFSETDGFGAAALEPSFAAQFVGKSVPIALTDIEAISGATYTSEAVIAAINAAYEEKNATPTPEVPTATEVAATEISVPEEKPAEVPEDVITVRKQGLMGPVAVTVSFNHDGTIAYLKVGDADFAETEGIGTPALEPGFAAQFIGKLPPLTVRGSEEESTPSNFDGISGATYTTDAVLVAINEAYETRPEAEALVLEIPAKVPEGAITVRKQGLMGPVAVTVSFNQDGTIAYLKVGDADFAETEGIGTPALEPGFAAQFIGKLPPLQVRKSEEVSTISNFDGISGATYTTDAVLEAINEAFASRP